MSDLKPGSQPQGNDQIRLTGIEVFAHHGVLASEKENGQLFLVDLEITLDLGRAGESDRLEDTVDYGALANAVHDVVAGERWDLLERVAQRVAEVAFGQPKVVAVAVTVHKPGAPIFVPFADVAVTIRRRR